MAMRKATSSKDGLPRFTVSVKHRIGRDWLIEFVASRLAMNDPIQSKTELWKSINEELKNRGGDSAFYWNDKYQAVDEEAAEEFRRQATLIVESWFPELSMR